MLCVAWFVLLLRFLAYCFNEVLHHLCDLPCLAYACQLFLRRFLFFFFYSIPTHPPCTMRPAFLRGAPTKETKERTTKEKEIGFYPYLPFLSVYTISHASVSLCIILSTRFFIYPHSFFIYPHFINIYPLLSLRFAAKLLRGACEPAPTPS